MSSRKPVTLLAAAIFLLIALVHLYRLAVGFPVSIAGQQVGMGISWVALLLAGALSIGLFREARG